jgi:transposase
MKQQRQHATKDILYIGFDVHKNSIAIACARSDAEEPTFYGSCGGSNLAVERALNRLCKKFDVTKPQVRIAYEAGPTGFVLVRRLLQLGYDTIVVAPSKMERAAGEKVKTDKKDAIKIARQLRGGMLKGIYIPEARTEAFRDLCRARTDASEDLRRDKQRLCAFLLRQGMHYDGRTNWTEAHMRYLRKVKLADPVLDQILEDYIRTIEEAIERVRLLEEKLEQVLLEWKEGAPYVKALKAFRGFKTVSAMTIASELGSLKRFKHPRQLMGYLGLVTGENSTGDRRRQGSITKCGNSHVRWILVESAQHYRFDPKVSPQLSKRQEGQSKNVKDISWRAQNRLNYRYKRLSARKLNRNKVIIAMARELSAFIWELFTTLPQPQSELQALPELSQSGDRPVAQPA